MESGGSIGIGKRKQSRGGVRCGALPPTIVIAQSISGRSSPMKNTATVPGPA